MRWSEIERDWPRLEPRVRRHWFRLTSQDVASTAGRREVLVERLMARYGFSSTQAEREIEAWAWLVTSVRAA